ncbi:hypothetical protein, partial [Micromonospora inyonensis]|uniref:hypothetical protein n=1 Tax=Micromonospora inyonensis TaxID=47866 RepID=UPI001C40851E
MTTAISTPVSTGPTSRGDGLAEQLGELAGEGLADLGGGDLGAQLRGDGLGEGRGDLLEVGERLASGLLALGADLGHHLVGVVGGHAGQDRVEHVEVLRPAGMPPPVYCQGRAR